MLALLRSWLSLATSLSAKLLYVVCATAYHQHREVKLLLAQLGNILNCFPTDDGWATIARLCFGLNMCTTFPLEAFGKSDLFFVLFWFADI